MEVSWAAGLTLTSGLDLHLLAVLHVEVSPVTELPGAVQAGGGLDWLEDLLDLG